MATKRGRKRSLLVRDATSLLRAVAVHNAPSRPSPPLSEIAQQQTQEKRQQNKERRGRQIISDPDRETFPCPDCGKIYYSAQGRTYHLRTKHVEKKKQKEEDEEVSGGPGRKAARRALKRFTKIFDVTKEEEEEKKLDEATTTTTLDSDVEQDSESSFAPSPAVDGAATSPQSSSSDENDEFDVPSPIPASAPVSDVDSPASLLPLESHDLTPSSPKAPRKKYYWKDGFTPEQLEIVLKQKNRKKKKLPCFNEGCKASFTSFEGLGYHHVRCGKKYECPTCEGVFLTERKLQTHQKKCGKREILLDGDRPADFDLFIGPMKRLYRRGDPRGYRQAQFKLTGPDTRARGWTKTSREEIFENGESFLTSLMPKSENWIALSAEEQSAYLPPGKRLSFSCNRGPLLDEKKKKKQEEEEEKEEEEEEEEKAEDSGRPSLASSSSFQLDLFESMSFEGAELTHMANAGVPTWTADWCPQSGSQTEYFALSTNGASDEARYDCPGLIQVWEFDSAKRCESLKFSFGIAHNWGRVRDIRWCPNPAACQSESNRCELWRRLGILAVACSTGKIHLISIPHPVNLGTRDGENRIFRVIPSLSLAPESSSSVHGQAWCLTWNKRDCAKISAGFSDGSVGVWNIETNVEWLCDALKSQVYPIQHFLAHTSSVCTLEWCPVENNIIVTAAHGKDASVRLWDLRDISRPLYDLGNSTGNVCDIQWLPYWNSLLCAGDTSAVSTLLQHRINLINLSQRGGTEKSSCYPLKQYIAQRSAPFLSLSYSDWTNTVAFSSADGTVGISILPIATTPKTFKGHGYWELYRAEKDKKNEDNLLFIDAPTKFSRSGCLSPPTDKLSWITSLSGVNFATNRVRMCPNDRSAHLLLCCVGSGLVRLIEVKRLKPKP